MRRILRKFRIDEISGVDSPAQKDARFVIMKRASAEGATMETNETKSTDVTKLEEQAAAMAAELKKQREDLESKVDTLTKRLDNADKVIALSPELRKYYDSLSGDEQAGFLSKSAEEQQQAAANAEEEDPVVYTTTQGDEIRKSAGSAVLSMAKSLDAFRKANAELVKQRKHDELTKRAAETMEHFPGDENVRVAILGAVEGIADDAVRKSALESLKANNDKLSKAFETYGHSGETDLSKADDKLEKMARKYAADNKVSFEDAYEKILETDDGARLYAEVAQN